MFKKYECLYAYWISSWKYDKAKWILFGSNQNFMSLWKSPLKTPDWSYQSLWVYIICRFYWCTSCKTDLIIGITIRNTSKTLKRERIANCTCTLYLFALTLNSKTTYLHKLHKADHSQTNRNDVIYPNPR